MSSQFLRVDRGLARHRHQQEFHPERLEFFVVFGDDRQGIGALDVGLGEIGLGQVAVGQVRQFLAEEEPVLVGALDGKGIRRAGRGDDGLHGFGEILRRECRSDMTRAES